MVHISVTFSYVRQNLIQGSFVPSAPVNAALLYPFFSRDPYFFAEKFKVGVSSFQEIQIEIFREKKFLYYFSDH